MAPATPSSRVSHCANIYGALVASQLTLLLIIAAAGYFLGSIPFGYLLVRVLRGQDIRETGSGNIGATNVGRSSPWLGVVTLVLDAAKGSSAVALAIVLSRMWHSGHSLRQASVYAALAGVAAILGHMFPVWLKFRGGKGVATSLGAFAMIAPKAILVALAAFVVVLVAFRYVSLSSMSAVAVFPFALWLWGDCIRQPLVFGLAAFAAVMVLVMHQENIRRLLSGSEPQIRWRRA